MALPLPAVGTDHGRDESTLLLNLRYRVCPVLLSVILCNSLVNPRHPLRGPSGCSPAGIGGP